MISFLYAIKKFFVNIYNYLFEKTGKKCLYYKIRSNKNGICFPIFSNNCVYFITNYHILNNINDNHNNKKIILTLNSIKYDLQIERKNNKYDLLLLKIKNNTNIRFNKM